MYNLFDTDKNVPVPLDPLTGYAVRKELFDSPPLFSYYSERILIDILDDYLMEKYQQYQKEITDYFIKINKYDCNFSIKQKTDVSYPSSPIVDFDIEIKIPTDVESYLFLFQLDFINNLIPARDHSVISCLNINENLIDYYQAVPIEIKIGDLSLVRLYDNQPTDYGYLKQYTLIVRNNDLLVFSREYIPAILFKENKFSSNHYALDLYSRSTYKKVLDSVIKIASAAPYYFYPIDINFTLLDKDVKSKNIKISSIVPLKISIPAIRYWPITYEAIRTPVFAEVWIRRKGDIDDLYEKTSLVYNGFEKFFTRETEYDTVGFKVSLSKDLIKKKQDAEEIYLSYGQSESKRPLPFYRRMEEHHFDFYQTPIHPIGLRASIAGIPKLLIEQKSDSLNSYIEKEPIPFSFRYEILKELIRYNMLRMDLDVEWKCFPLKVANFKEAWRYNITFIEFLYGRKELYKVLRDKYPVLTSPADLKDINEGRKFCIFYVKPNHLIVRSAERDRVYIYDPQCCYNWYRFDLENSQLVDSDKWPYSIQVDYEKDYSEILCDVHDKKSILYHYRGPIRVDIHYYLNLHGEITFGSIEPANYDNNWYIYYDYDTFIPPLFFGRRNDGYAIGHYTEYINEALIYNNEYLIIGYPPYHNSVKIFKLGQTYDIGNIFLTYSLSNKGDINIYSKFIKNGYITGETEESLNASTYVLIAKEQEAPSGGILLLPEYGEQFYKALVEIAESTTLSCTTEDYLVTYLMLLIEDYYQIVPYVVYKYSSSGSAIIYKSSPVKIYRYYLFKIKKRRILKSNYDSDTVSFTYKPEKKKINATVIRNFKLKSPKRIYHTRITKNIRGEFEIYSIDLDAHIYDILRDYKNFDLEDTEVELVWSKTVASTEIYPLELLIEKARESNYEIIEAAYLYHYKNEHVRCCWIPSAFGGDIYSIMAFDSDWPISVSNDKPVLHLYLNPFTDYSSLGPPDSSLIMTSDFQIETNFDVSQNDYTINEQKFICPNPIVGIHSFVTILIDVYKADDNSILGSSFAVLHHFERDDTKKDFRDIFINIEIRNRNKYGDIISIEPEANFYDVTFSRTIRFQ